MRILMGQQGNLLRIHQTAQERKIKLHHLPDLESIQLGVFFIGVNIKWVIPYPLTSLSTPILPPTSVDPTRPEGAASRLMEKEVSWDKQSTTPLSRRQAPCLQSSPCSEKEVLTWNEDLRVAILIPKLRWYLLNYIGQITQYYLRMDGKLRNLTDFFYSKGREEFPLLKYLKGTSEDRKKQKNKTKNLHFDYLTKFACSK